MFKLSKLLKGSFGNLNVPKHKIIIDPKSYRLAHPVWSLEAAQKVEITHHKPENTRDWLAYGAMKALRTGFDLITGYNPGDMNEAKYIKRMIFLETVAGVPGMVGAMIRHMKSLGNMREDGGWIHHLMEEAENERMHLLTFLKIRSPGILFRLNVLLVQWIFLIGFSSVYALSPKTAHRFVGYLEEEAVKTYTQCLNDFDAGKLRYWQNMPADIEAIKYWGLPENATFRDVLVEIRADEVLHREVNHNMADKDAFDKWEAPEYHVTNNPIGEALNFEKEKPKIEEKQESNQK